jgi:hypothetical protein
LLEKLAATTGCAELFERLRGLTERVLVLGDGGAGARLAHEWIDEQLADPLPADVVEVVRSVSPFLVDEPVLEQGFHAWATSIHPAAAEFLDEISRAAAARGVEHLSVIVLPAAERRATRTAGSSARQATRP